MITGKELAQKVLDHVEAHPDQHDQSIWINNPTPGATSICNTTACLAGWAVLLNREENEPPYTTLFRLAGGFDIPADWETVAIRLLLPEGEADAEGELSNAFYSDGDNEEGVRRFASALGLDIPEA